MAQYSITLSGLSVSAAQDIIQLTAPTDAQLRLLFAEVAATTAEAAEQVPVALYRATAGGTGTAGIAEGLDAVGGTYTNVKTNLTVAATKATQPLYRRGTWLQQGFVWRRVPDVFEIDVPASGILVLRIDGAPAGATVMDATLVFDVVV